MKSAIAVLVVVALIALAVGGMYVGRRNVMVQKNETVKSAWAQVDVVLQRRADLIPNLVETVKGIRGAGADRVSRYRQRPVRAVGRANASG